MKRKETSTDRVVKALRRASREAVKLPPGRYHKVREKYLDRRKEIDEILRNEVNDYLEEQGEEE